MLGGDAPMNSAHRRAQEYTEGRRLEEIRALERRRFDLVSMQFDPIEPRLSLDGLEGMARLSIAGAESPIGASRPFSR